MGDRGAGKTCLLTFLLKLDYDRSRKIISNYHLQFDFNYMTLTDISELPDEVQNATIGLDELQVGADSRRALSKANLGITKLATQLRKRVCILYYTTQRFNLVDKRMRDQTDYIITSEATGKEGIFKIKIMDRGTGDILKEKIFDGKPVFDLYDSWEIVDKGEES